MPRVLEEIYRIQSELSDMDEREKLLLKMCVNLLESYHEVKSPRNALTEKEYLALPGRWEMVGGMLLDY